MTLELMQTPIFLCQQSQIQNLTQFTGDDKTALDLFVNIFVQLGEAAPYSKELSTLELRNI